MPTSLAFVSPYTAADPGFEARGPRLVMIGFVGMGPSILASVRPTTGHALNPENNCVLI